MGSEMCIRDRDRLKLANINGIFEENREYGNVLGALRALQQK